MVLENLGKNSLKEAVTLFINNVKKSSKSTLANNTANAMSFTITGTNTCVSIIRTFYSLSTKSYTSAGGHFCSACLNGMSTYFNYISLLRGYNVLYSESSLSCMCLGIVAQYGIYYGTNSNFVLTPQALRIINNCRNIAIDQCGKRFSTTDFAGIVSCLNASMDSCLLGASGAAAAKVAHKTGVEIAKALVP